MAYKNIREEELKIKIAKDYFDNFDCSNIIGNLDFCVSSPAASHAETDEIQSILWAEAKKGKSDIYKSITQLILTIGKARTFDKFLPPAFLGAFDAEKIAFIPYNNIQDIFYINDFNWSVTPSNHDSKEFLMVLEKVKTIIDKYFLLFYFDNDKTEIHQFINDNFIFGKSETAKIKIDKNNFLVVYNKWLKAVKPTIAVSWEAAKKVGILDGDFYLADLISENKLSLKNKLDVYLKSDHYIFDKKIDEIGEIFRTMGFNDKQKAHSQFWNKYERPPNEIYWDYILQRR
jgi:hypothetical protein